MERRSSPSPRKPEWLRTRLPGGSPYRSVRGTLGRESLRTVCEEARCPNLGECWACGTATFLILGGLCTRGCGFCAVARGDPGGQADEGEPARVAEAVRTMGLRYAVVTSVTRDDLPDGGASTFARTVRSLKALEPAPLVEVLVPDYAADRLGKVLEAGPDVLAHNLEVVERLSPAIRHAGFDYRRSLAVLRNSRALAPRIVTKSSLLLGLGETRDEVLRAMADLREAGVDLLVLGQYLRPSSRQVAVREYLRPEAFDRLADEARRMGFGHVSAGPLVRTSYRAAEAYVERLARGAPGA